MAPTSRSGRRIAMPNLPARSPATFRPRCSPMPADVAEVHGFIRERLIKRFAATGEEIRILYGGSVKPSNAAELLHVANVDGTLVGGSSLKADDFLGIATAYR